MLLHLMVVEKALGRLLLVKATVLHSSTVEVPARLALYLLHRKLQMTHNSFYKQILMANGIK